MEQFAKETDIEASVNPIRVMKREQYSNLLYTLNEYAAKLLLLSTCSKLSLLHTPLSIPFASFLYFTPIFSRILF
jgi:hypothetical protein